MNSTIEKLENIIGRIENIEFPKGERYGYDCYGCCNCCSDYSDFNEDIANQLKEVVKELKGEN